jgi:hypothetical protein
MESNGPKALVSMVSFTAIEGNNFKYIEDHELRAPTSTLSAS